MKQTWKKLGGLLLAAGKAAAHVGAGAGLAALLGISLGEPDGKPIREVLDI